MSPHPWKRDSQHSSRVCCSFRQMSHRYNELFSSYYVGILQSSLSGWLQGTAQLELKMMGQVHMKHLISPQPRPRSLANPMAAFWSSQQSEKTLPSSGTVFLWVQGPWKVVLHPTCSCLPLAVTSGVLAAQPVSCCLAKGGKLCFPGWMWLMPRASQDYFLAEHCGLPTGSFLCHGSKIP